MGERSFSPGENYKLDLEFIIGKIVICNLRKWFGFYLCKHSCSSAYYNLIKDMMNGRYQILICVNPFSILYTISPFFQITHTRSFARSIFSSIPFFLYFCVKKSSVDMRSPFMLSHSFDIAYQISLSFSMYDLCAFVTKTNFNCLENGPMEHLILKWITHLCDERVCAWRRYTWAIFMERQREKEKSER